jgi:hypothetical protein
LLACYECAGGLSTRAEDTVGSTSSPQIFFTAKLIVPLITKPKKMAVAFATTSLPNYHNKHINQYDKIILNHWHGLCICFE